MATKRMKAMSVKRYGERRPFPLRREEEADNGAFICNQHLHHTQPKSLSFDVFYVNIANDFFFP